jgi:hypothetical protein
MNAPTLRHHRFWVGCALKNSPLVRRQDRLEARVTVAMLVLLVLTLPLAVLVGRAATAAEHERNAQYMQSLRAVEAEVVELRNGTPSRVPHLTRQVGVKWLEGFEERTEYVASTELPKIGDHITVWLDKSGRVAPPPKSPTDIQGPGLGVGVAVMSTAALLVFGTLAVLRAALDRRRYEAWDQEWLEFSTGNGHANWDR